MTMLKMFFIQNPESLEDLCIMRYLKYLEQEVVTYIALTQSKSRILKGVSKRMLKVRISYWGFWTDKC